MLLLLLLFLLRWWQLPLSFPPPLRLPIWRRQRGRGPGHSCFAGACLLLLGLLMLLLLLLLLLLLQPFVQRLHRGGTRHRSRDGSDSGRCHRRSATGASLLLLSAPSGGRQGGRCHRRRWHC